MAAGWHPCSVRRIVFMPSWRFLEASAPAVVASRTPDEAPLAAMLPPKWDVRGTPSRRRVQLNKLEAETLRVLRCQGQHARGRAGRTLKSVFNLAAHNAGMSIHVAAQVAPGLASKALRKRLASEALPADVQLEELDRHLGKRKGWRLMPDAAMKQVLSQQSWQGGWSHKFEEPKNFLLGSKKEVVESM